MKRSFIVICGLLVVITLVFATLYATVQHTIRSTADTTQIVQAENTRAQLESGTPPSGLTLTTVDVSKTIAPFIIVYDTRGKEVASGVTLGGTTPSLPKGVLANTTRDTQNRVSWQPTATVRIAAVVTQTNDGKYYILGGRSLRETEKLESRVLLFTVLGWVASLGIVAASYIVLQKKALS